METKRNGKLTEYGPAGEGKTEQKKVTDVSYLFSDEYDEAKAPLHYTKKRNAWTSTLRRSGMRAATARSITALPITRRDFQEKKAQEKKAKEEKTATKVVSRKSLVAGDKSRKKKAEAAPVSATADTVPETSGKPALEKIKAVKPTAPKSSAAKPKTAKSGNRKITTVQGVGKKTPEVAAKTTAKEAKAKTAAGTTAKTSSQGTALKTPAKKTATKPESSKGTAKPVSNQNTTVKKKTAATSTSAKAATSRISATRVAANITAETEKQNAKPQTGNTQIVDSLTTAQLPLTERLKVTQKKKVWPFMVMIALVVFIASLVTFLYLIRSSQDIFFLSIRDKEAPILQVTDLDIYNNETVTVDDFVVECDDQTRVKVYLQSPIDYSIDGEQKVTIIAEDEAGHKTVRSATLMHITDETPPRITGDPLIRTVRGESIAYKSHISVLDDYDPEPVIEINNSEVNLEEEGSYPIWYTATDRCGNQSVLQSEVVVSAPSAETVSDEEVNALVDSIMSQIITEDMQPIDKVWAIYEYVRHIQYAKGEYSYNYKYEGYKYLRDQKGDCYGSYAAAKLFFDRLGYPNLSLEKKGGSTHFWNMVSIDGGKTFYHFDATFWHEWTKKPVMCMISDAVLEQISVEHKGTHQYDHSLFPATPADSLPVPDYVPEKYGEDY